MSFFFLTSLRKARVAGQHARRLMHLAIQAAPANPQRSGFSLLVDAYGSRR